MTPRTIQTKINRNSLGRAVACTASLVKDSGETVRVRVPNDGIGLDEMHTRAVRKLLSSEDWDGAYVGAKLGLDAGHYAWVPCRGQLATTSEKWIGVYIAD